MVTVLSLSLAPPPKVAPEKALVETRWQHQCSLSHMPLPDDLLHEMPDLGILCQNPLTSGLPK